MSPQVGVDHVARRWNEAQRPRPFERLHDRKLVEDFGDALPIDHGARGVRVLDDRIAPVRAEEPVEATEDERRTMADLSSDETDMGGVEPPDPSKRAIGDESLADIVQRARNE